MHNLNEPFETLRELRAFTDSTGNSELKKSLTDLENTAAQEVLGVDLQEKPLDYDKIWQQSFPQIKGSIEPTFRKALDKH